MIKSFRSVVNAQGIRGLYRGCVPPLLGSGVYRSLQFAVYEGAFTYCAENNIGADNIPVIKSTSTDQNHFANDRFKRVFIE
jgi:hypothetical protein